MCSSGFQQQLRKLSGCSTSECLQSFSIKLLNVSLHKSKRCIHPCAGLWMHTGAHPVLQPCLTQQTFFCIAIRLYTYFNSVCVFLWDCELCNRTKIRELVASSSPKGEDHFFLLQIHFCPHKRPLWPKWLFPQETSVYHFKEFWGWRTRATSGFLPLASSCEIRLQNWKWM